MTHFVADGSCRCPVIEVEELCRDIRRTRPSVLLQDANGECIPTMTSSGINEMRVFHGSTSGRHLVVALPRRTEPDVQSPRLRPYTPGRLNDPPSVGTIDEFSASAALNI